jgi:hypothetical protein
MKSIQQRSISEFAVKSQREDDDRSSDEEEANIYEVIAKAYD